MSLAVTVECRRCGAKPGEECRTRTGRPAQVHALRYADAHGIIPADPPLADVLDLDAARIRRQARKNGFTG